MRTASLALLMVCASLAGCSSSKPENARTPGTPTISVYDMLSRQPRIVADSQGNLYVRGYARPPLYVIDGTYVEGADVRFLNPHDVQRIRVLDGAEATLYGSRGANGVVEITTRKPGGARNR